MNNQVLIVSTLIATMSACSSLPEPNTALNQAQRQLNAAEDNSQVTSLASEELAQAQEALQLAESSWEKKEDLSRTNHLAYMASQKVKIAQDTASKQASLAISSNASAERDKLLLSVRTKQANKAQELNRISTEALAAAKRKASETTRQHQARLLELESELESLNAKQTERGIVITLGDVLFKTGESGISSHSALTLSKLADFLKRYPKQLISIEGHTDNTGSESGNYALSQQRAHAVETALLERGVNNSQLSTQAFGQSKPVADNSTALGRQLNRRVDIVFDQTSEKISTRI